MALAYPLAEPADGREEVVDLVAPAGRQQRVHGLADPLVVR